MKLEIRTSSEYRLIISESEDTLSSGDKSDILLEIPLKKISDPTTEETLIWKGNSYSPYLLQFHEALHNILCHYCGTIYEYLNSLDNVYDIIAEYTARVSQHNLVIFSGKHLFAQCLNLRISLKRLFKSSILIMSKYMKDIPLSLSFLCGE